jgi:hypothetical protein
MESKYDEIFSLIRKREGFERSQEIVESLQYLFDINRYDKAIPFIDYQQNLISLYRDELFYELKRNKYYKYILIISIAINIFFIGLQIWRTIK